MEMEENRYTGVTQFFELFQTALQESYSNPSSKAACNVLWDDNAIKFSFNLVEKKQGKKIRNQSDLL